MRASRLFAALVAQREEHRNHMLTWASPPGMTSHRASAYLAALEQYDQKLCERLAALAPYAASDCEPTVD